ncbi:MULTISPECIES: xanthine dehydrogenase family protein molybdopterin-binding subunit [Metallosphaera]|uniref:xanthine dehydrogenase family protein molybdopterin-binding subunit n=1 Tax=Metallosphaera TaxID=41980 RepID=UPI001F05B66D|nr:xanthine dehydrogenase family protein molybdopterin-binding subunit [Metallosphaera sedula]MCH1770953.1 xanthine dehydrogenase family protein molybdopterin-binding subunit [Metallosphaera sedula]MCP6729310.1 xanthine dehydrogenase family protein molybdopterin-binding subunit [Metallosphaera sedula]
MRYVGKPVRRVEDPKLITGRGSFVDDIQIPGTYYVAFVRSKYPHARISVKPSQNVFTGSQINPGKDFPIPSNEVTYAGQPIAAVIARDRYEAYDLLESVEVEYEQLPYETDPFRAMEDKVKVYSKAESNIYAKKEFFGGEAKKELEQSPIVLSGELHNQRIIASPMETRGTLAWFDGNRLNVWSSTQSAHYLRRNLVSFLGIQNIRVIQPDVGGAFGSKIITHPEEYAVSFLALKLGIPLKWIPTRTEEMLSAGHGRDKWLRYKVGVKRDGTITAVVGTVVGNLGAPYRDANDDDSGNVMSAARMLPGPYRIKHGFVAAYSVNTNLTPTTSYRGAGRPEATYFIESIIEEIAEELKLDPLEVRLRNVIRPEEMPYTNVFGITYDSGNYPELLNSAKSYYEQLKAEAKDNQCVGLAMYVEITAFGPWETARVYAKYDGRIVVVTGTGPHGQGDATAFAQLAADALEISMDLVEVRWGDTDVIEDGIGTWGSRTVTIGGSAVIMASQELRKRLTEAGAKALEADVEEVEYREGKVVHKKTGKSLELAEIIKSAYKLGISLDVTSVYPVKKPTSPYGVHMALMEIDRETGLISVKKYIAVDDVGNVINPLLAEGQIHGGALQGISQALYEEAVINDGTLQNPTFGDYALPTAVETPRFTWKYLTNGLSPHPTGSKGIGEAGTVVGTPVISNAISSCLKKKFSTMPILLEKVLGDQ